MERVFNITENGFAVDGSGRVVIPACRITAISYLDAAAKLDAFLESGKLTDDIELLTPFDKIQFSQPIRE